MARLHSIKSENVKNPEMRSILFNGKPILYQSILNMLKNLPEKYDDETKQER